MAGWSFCQRRIGRDCVQPFSMFFLQVLGCFCGAEKQLSNSLESSNCFLVMRWIDIHLATVLFISPSALSTERRSQVRRVCDWNASPLPWINRIYLWLWASTILFKLIQDCPSKVKESGFFSEDAFFDGYLLPSCFSASERFLPPDAVKRKEHILQNWQGLFFLLSELFVKQLFCGDNALNIKHVHLFLSFFLDEISARWLYTAQWKLNTGNTKIEWQLLWGVMNVFMWERAEWVGARGVNNFLSTFL